MRLVRQESRIDCLACAAAMALGIELAEIIAAIGHDGCAMAVEELGDPAGLIGFHPQEIVDVALDRGYAMTEIEAFPHQILSNHFVPVGMGGEERWLKHLRRTKLGILLVETDRGAFHAIAWDGTAIYDPRGEVYSIDEKERHGINFIDRFFRLDLIRECETQNG